MNFARILVVDDDPVILALLSTFLARQGYHVRTASSGGEAVRRFAAGEFDLVITDLQLGDLSGFEVIRRVKQLRPRVPVYLMTGSRDPALAAEAIRHGADVFFSKPLSLSELLDCLNRRQQAARPFRTGPSRRAASFLSGYLTPC